MRWILNRAKNNLTNFGCPKCITDGTRLHLCTYFRAISFKYKSDSLYCFRCEVSENFPFWLRNQLNLFIINLIDLYFPLHKFMVHKCNLKIFSIAVLHCLLVKFERSNFWSLFLFFTLHFCTARLHKCNLAIFSWFMKNVVGEMYLGYTCVTWNFFKKFAKSFDDFIYGVICVL